MKNRKSKIENRNSRRCRGLSLIELLISLMITAMLLTATMVAIDASFQAYAAAAESASTQTTTRLVTHRLLSMIRTSTAHGPLVEEPAYEEGGINYPAVTLNDQTITSHYLELIDSRGDLIRIEYREPLQQLWVTRTPFGGATQAAQPLLGGVSSATFYAKRRVDIDGVLVLERASIDMAIVADDDNSLELEANSQSDIRVVASTMPRRLD